jgi:hypothetical protein
MWLRDGEVRQRVNEWRVLAAEDVRNDRRQWEG